VFDLGKSCSILGDESLWSRHPPQADQRWTEQAEVARPDVEKEHKRRLLVRLDALKRAVEADDIPEDVLEKVYNELFRLDELFPAGVKTHSILELEGLGAEIWRNIDVDEYIREERRSWR
jgi:hypothetical protein